MMITIRNLSTLFVALLITTFAHAQMGTLFKNNEERGDKYFEEFSYTEAIEEYKIAFEKSSSNRVVIKIAESYRKLNDPNHSSEWYAKGVHGDVKDPATYLHYADALSSLQHYDEARNWYEKYSTLVPDDIRPKQKIRAIDNLKKFRDRSSEITIEKARFNSEASDFSPVFYENDQIVFVSSRESGTAFANVFSWDNSEYLNLYVTDKTNKSKLFGGGINSKYHEGPLSIYNDNQKIIFTRNDFSDNSLGADAEGVTKLKLYSASRMKSGDWTKPLEFKFNSADYSVGHPAVTEDGKILVFVSDMPGGVGGTDLYISRWVEDGWSQPINLGNIINTEGNELFPYLNSEEQLFFSSDGHGGFGGLDIFAIDLNAATDRSHLVNLGKPINSSFDDFSLIIKGDHGFFSSNREGGKNNDDIYSFKAHTPLVQLYTVKVMVASDSTNDPISEAALILRDSTGTVVNQYLTNKQGESVFTVEPFSRYSLVVTKNDFEADTVTIDVDGQALVKLQHLTLQKTIHGSDTPGGIDESFLPSTVSSKQTIYFEFRESGLGTDAKKKLKEVIRLLQEKENLGVSLVAHTDSRGDVTFNQKLSDKRLKATTRFMTSHGISVERITGSGVGESQLVNKCIDGVDCSEEEHQANRRIEVKIIHQ